MPLVPMHQRGRVAFFFATKGVQGAPCRGFGGLEPNSSPSLNKRSKGGVQGAPCRGFGGVPQYFPFPNKGVQGPPCRGLGDWSPTLSPNKK